MSDLKSFAELIAAGKEAKRHKDLTESIRTQKELAPLLGELFKSVSVAKRIEEKRQNVIHEVDELKANQITQTDISELLSEKIEGFESEAETEKMFTKIVKQLQADIVNLKNMVSNVPTYSAGGTAGSGEVRILRMDDIVRLTNPPNGSTLVWNTSLNKFELVVPTGTGTTDEEMPYAKRIDFITDSLLYKAEAAVGSLETDPVWRIHKVVIGTDSDVTETWADGDSTYTKVWADRLTYNYV